MEETAKLIRKIGYNLCGYFATSVLIAIIVWSSFSASMPSHGLDYLYIFFTICLFGLGIAAGATSYLSLKRSEKDQEMLKKEE